ncbi:unnamed protein product, partial [Iphiclides podalirius]
MSSPCFNSEYGEATQQLLCRRNGHALAEVTEVHERQPAGYHGLTENQREVEVYRPSCRTRGSDAAALRRRPPQKDDPARTADKCEKFRVSHAAKQRPDGRRPQNGPLPGPRLIKTEESRRFSCAPGIVYGGAIERP